MVSRLIRSNETMRTALNLPRTAWVDWFELASASNAYGTWIETAPPGAAVHEIPTLSDERNRGWFEERTRIELDATGLAVIPGGSVLGHNGGQFFDRDRRFLWNLGTENWRYFGCFYADSAVRLPRIQHIRGTVAVLAHPYAYRNFSHWVFDVLPKIGIIEQTVGLADVDVVLIGHTNLEYQLDTLEHLGVARDRVRVFRPSSHFSADRLLVPRVGGYNNMHQRSWAVDYILEKFGPKRDAVLGARLLVSRADASFRRLLQEDALFDRLEPLGFERVMLSGVGLPETVGMFRDAQSVVGGFGSGLMNIAFCVPKTTVVEIVSSAFYNCHHWYLSGERKLKHHVFFGDGPPLPRGNTNQLTKNISIDVDACHAFVCEACAS
jgi:capsular polysaccharide biosynthesis protein